MPTTDSEIIQKLIDLGNNVVGSTGHLSSCSFKGCTCGTVVQLKIDRSNWLRYAKDIGRMASEADANAIEQLRAPPDIVA
jgi:hypothetical protein